VSEPPPPTDGSAITRREALSLAAVPLVVAAGVGADKLIGEDERPSSAPTRRGGATCCGPG
jgi:hypothetical protein